MGKRIAKVLDIDGQYRENPDFPVAVVSDFIDKDEVDKDEVDFQIVDPVFNSSVTRNLYGRIMTIVEATTDAQKLKAVKDVFSKELRAWESDVYSSAREIAKGGDSSSNLYTKH